MGGSVSVSAVARPMGVAGSSMAAELPCDTTLSNSSPLPFECTLFSDAPVPEECGIAVEARCEQGARTLDEIYALLLADIAQLSDVARLNTRYALLTNRSNAGVCAEDLGSDRQALFKLLNSVSTASKISLPIAVDEEKTLYRLDLRDYGWEREVSIGATAFTNGWEAVVANNPLSVEFEGESATPLIEQTGTRVPWLYADALVHAVLKAPLYYALLGVELDQSIDDFLRSTLQIDVPELVVEEELVRAYVELPDAGVHLLQERYELASGRGAVWQDFDLRNRDFQLTPLALPGTSSFLSYPLSNGLFGYVIANAARVIVDKAPPLGALSSTREIAAVFRAYAWGIRPLLDELRSAVEQSRFNYNADDFEAVQNIYPRPDRFIATATRDSCLYQLALQLTGVDPSAPDPISSVLKHFDTDLGLGEVAGELGVSISVLSASLADLNERLGDLPRTALSRAEWTGVYVQSLCRVHANSVNRPSSSLCSLPN